MALTTKEREKNEKDIILGRELDLYARARCR